MKYEVLIQPHAASEIEHAYHHIRARSAERAAHWYDGLVEAILSLEYMPHRCAVAPENDFYAEDVRQLLHPPYRVLFSVRGETVHVIHVRHVAQSSIE